MPLPLAERTFVMPRPGDPPLELDAIHGILGALPEWSLEGEGICRRFRFPDFATGLAFTNRVGALAEAVGHHPNITLTWGRVEVRLWTHDVGGLTEADFILAARIDAVL